MPKGSPSRPKHVPQRTCVACRQVGGKRGLIRLVRTEQGVEIDPSGKKAGRGAYLHPERNCWEIALKGNRIEQALRVRLSPESRRSLVEYMQKLSATAGEIDGDRGETAEGQAVQAAGRE